jgi:hypothetical protein
MRANLAAHDCYPACPTQCATLHAEATGVPQPCMTNKRTGIGGGGTCVRNGVGVPDRDVHPCHLITI